MSSFIQRLFGQLDYDDIMAMKQKHNVKGLVNALNNNKETVRSLAAQTLVESGDPQAIEPLIVAAYEETDQYCYKAMMLALSNSKDPRVADACIVLLQTSGKEKPAITTLEKLHERGMLGNQAIEKLIELLNNEWNIAVVAAEVLGKLRATEAIPALIGSLNGTNEYLSREAAKALRTIGGTTALNAVAEYEDKKALTCQICGKVQSERSQLIVVSTYSVRAPIEFWEKPLSGTLYCLSCAKDLEVKKSTSHYEHIYKLAGDQGYHAVWNIEDRFMD